MQLEPYVGTTPVRSDSFSIVVNPADQSRIDAVASRARDLTQVSTPVEFARAKELAGQIRAVLNEIADAEKAAKRPFAAVKAAIEAKAKEVSAYAASEHQRLLDLTSEYVRRIEAKEKQLAREREEALKAEQARLKAEKEKAWDDQESARCALKNTELTQEQAKPFVEQYEQAQKRSLEADLEMSIAASISELGNGKGSLVPEGGVRHTPQFTLTDPKALIMGGYIRLLRFELDKLACNDCYKRMLMLNPDKEPEIPGLRIEMKTSVYIRPQS